LHAPQPTNFLLALSVTVCRSFFAEEVSELEAYADTADSKSVFAPQQALRNFLSHPDTLADFLQGRRQVGGLSTDQITGTPLPPLCGIFQGGTPSLSDHVQLAGVAFHRIAAVGSLVCLEEESQCHDPESPVGHSSNTSAKYAKHGSALGDVSSTSSNSSVGQLAPAFTISGEEEEECHGPIQGSTFATCTPPVWVQRDCGERLPTSADRSWSGLSCGQQAALQSFNGHSAQPHIDP
jgi:hypothetical protein